MSDDRVPARILARGVSSGLFLMAFFTLGWAGNTFAGWPPAVAGAVWALALLGAAWFVVRGVQLIRARPRMPEPVLSDEDARLGRTIGRNFGLVFGAEFLTIFVATAVLGLTGLSDYNVPVIALIVGLHFYPLGRIFRRRIDAYVATWVAAVGVAGIVVLAATDVRPESVWSAVGLGAALGTAAYGIYFALMAGRMLARYPRNSARPGGALV
jgi:NADH:ubiquinone oxidoreductase subunit 6 (subunit J)